MNKPVKAVGLLSGGLDSTLAARMLQNQGIEVLGLNLYTGFCVTETKRRTGTYKPGDYKPNEALKTGGDLELPVEIIDIAAEGYFNVIKNPKYGRGKNVNPCIDCRIFMFHRAKQYMEEVGADFIFTGEVLGQRPMSQHRQAMKTIEQQSGLVGLLLRPLSAKLMEPTIPELDGRVNRELLGELNGRSRKPQLQMAVDYGLTDWAQPAGGCCYLTDENFARKFNDLFEHDPERDLTKREANLLAIGRHFRIRPEVKFIIGRQEGENRALADEAAGDILIVSEIVPGPTALIQGPATDDEVRLVAGAVVRYADTGTNSDPVELRVLRPSGETALVAAPLSAAAVDAMKI
jgi:tRNA-uridine 2-sulfurtransferase